MLYQPAERLGILRKWPPLCSLIAPDVPADVIVPHPAMVGPTSVGTCSLEERDQSVVIGARSSALVGVKGGRRLSA